MEIRVTEIQEKLAEALKRLTDGGERIILMRHGKGVAALVSMEELKLLEDLEDQQDLRQGLQTRKEKGGINLAQYRKKHGI